MDSIGLLIREQRKKRGMTQADLAEHFQMSRATISGIEKGTVTEIGIRKVEAILNFFGYILVATPRRRRPTLDDLKE